MTRRRHAAQLLADYPNALRFRMRAARHRAVPPGFGRGELRPVVILPGIYESWHYLRPIAERLSAAGHPVHVIPALGLNRAPIPATAARVRQFVHDLDLRDAAIVAHSKGGIVGKQLLVQQEREARARADGEVGEVGEVGDAGEVGEVTRLDRLIAIASPFNGSALARIAPNPALRAFLPDNPVIAALAAETAVNARITSIYPSFDPHIPNGCELEGARNVEVPVIGHFRILLQPELIDAVLLAVERESHSGV